MSRTIRNAYVETPRGWAARATRWHGECGCGYCLKVKRWAKRTDARRERRTARQTLRKETE